MTMSDEPDRMGNVRIIAGMAVFIVLVSVAAGLLWGQRDAVRQLLSGPQHPQVERQSVRPPVASPVQSTAGRTVAQKTESDIPSPLHGGLVLLRPNAELEPLTPPDTFRSVAPQLAVLRTFQAHDGKIADLVQLPDTWHVLTAGPDGTVRQWDTRSGEMLATFPSDGAVVHDLDVSADGSRFATAGSNGKVRVWRVDSGAIELELSGHAGPVRSLGFSPDGKQLVSGGEDRSVRLWNLERGVEQRSAFLHDDPITCVAYLSDGASVLTGSQRGEVVHWSTNDGRELRYLYSGVRQPVTSFAFIPGTTAVMFGVADSYRSTTVRDVSTGLRYPTRDVCRTQMRQVLFREGDETYLSVDGKNYIIEKRLMDLKHIRQHTAPDVGNLVNIVPLPESQFATCDDTGHIVVWGTPVSESSVVTQLWQGHTKKIYAIAAAAKSNLAVTAGGSDKTARVWDIQGGKTRAVLEGHTTYVLGTAITNDGSRVVTSSFDATVRLWDADTGRQLSIFRGDQKYRQVIFGPLEETVIVANVLGDLIIVDMDDGSVVKRLRGHTRNIESLQLLPSGRLASIGEDKTIRLWDLDAGHEVAGYELSFEGAVVSGRVYSDGDCAAIAATNLSKPRKPWVSLWDLKNGVETARWYSGGRSPVSLAISADERFLATSDGITCGCRIWDLRTLRNIDRISIEDNWPKLVAWIPGKMELLTAGHQGVMHWKIPPPPNFDSDEDPAPPAKPEKPRP